MEKLQKTKGKIDVKQTKLKPSKISQLPYVPIKSLKVNLENYDEEGNQVVESDTPNSIHEYLKTELRSVSICKEFLTKNDNWQPSFGKLPVTMMGVIGSYLDYHEMMLKFRYLDKNWLVFTQNFTRYIEINYKTDYLYTKYHSAVKLKICIDKVYNGDEVVPILNHPYYTNANKIDLYYEVSFRNSLANYVEHIPTDSFLILKLINIFKQDLFSHDHLLKNVKFLTVFNTSDYFSDLSGKVECLKYITDSPYLHTLEHLKLEPYYMQNSVIKITDFSKFPNLKNLELPYLQKLVMLSPLTSYVEGDEYYDEKFEKDLSDFTFASVSDQDIGPLELSLLNVNWTHFDFKWKDAFTKPTNQLLNLRSIVLNNNSIVDKIFELYFADYSFKNLQNLDLRGNICQDIEFLSTPEAKEVFPILKSLYLNIDNTGHDYASSLINDVTKNLQILSVEWKTHITVDTSGIDTDSNLMINTTSLFLSNIKFQNVFEFFPNIKYIGLHKISSRHAEDIFRGKYPKLLTQIQGLSLEFRDIQQKSKRTLPKSGTKTKVKDDEFKNLKNILNSIWLLKNLKYLSLANFSFDLSKEDLHVYSKITILQFSNCKITGKTIPAKIWKYFPNLEYLSVSKWETSAQRYTKEAFYLPNLKGLSMDLCFINNLELMIKNPKDKVLTSDILGKIFTKHKNLTNLELSCYYNEDEFQRSGLEYNEAFYKVDTLSNITHIDRIILLFPLMKCMVEGPTYIPKIKVKSHTYYYDQNLSEVFTNYWQQMWCNLI